MVWKDDFERILPDRVIKNIAERKLLVVICVGGIFFIIIVIVLAALLGHCSTGGGVWPWAGRAGDCRTAPCLHAAGWLADNMDRSVNPCDDFYRYACGGWKARHSIPPDHSEVTIVQQLEEEIDEKLREIIEKIPKDQSSSTDVMTAAEGKLQIFFRSCVHDYGRMKDGGQTLIDLIRTTLKGWYVLDPVNWNRQWNFQDAVIGVQDDLLVYVFFSSHLVWDSDKSRYVLGLYPASMGLGSKNIYEHSDHSAKQDAYKDYMRTVGSLLLGDANVTVTPAERDHRVEQFVSDVYGLEKQLAEMMDISRRNRTLNARVTTNVGEMQRDYPQLNWKTMLTRMFDNLEVTDSTVVKLNSPYFFRQLNELIRNETNLNIRDRVFNNFLVWRMAFKYASDLSWEYREAGYRFREALYGSYEWPPTWKVCLQTIYGRLGSLLAYEFIKHHISPDRKADVTAIYADLRQAVADRILQLDWIDEETKKRAFRKLSAVAAVIGFSDSYYNKTVMDQLHSGLQISATAGYFRNLLTLNQFQRQVRVQLFLNSRENTVRHQPVLGGTANYWVTPFHVSFYNTLLLPGGAMLDPVYDSNRPAVINFGVLGTMLATELVRTVDETGRFYLPNGTYQDWWTNETSHAYEKTSECFKKYFDQLIAGPFLINGENYTVTVNGETQIYRLMDDLGGIRAAYYGYKKWRKDTGKSDPIPYGLDLTHDQLFFVSSVQTKCVLRTDEESYQYAMHNYIPEDMEVNSLLSHMTEFSEAFKCPRGSKMREAYQCQTF